MARRKKAAIAADKKIKALHPGKRISESGNVYYENRPNRSDVDRRKKFMAGGSTDDSPKIYVADLAAYNEGKLIGEWLDLSNYDSGSEVMDAIQELLEKWSEEQGVEREEYAIHDAEFIPSNLYSEYMGEDTFDKIIEIRKVAEDVGVPTEVITQWMSDTGHDDPTSASDAYYGRYTDEEDFAYQMVDDLGIESFIDFERYLYVSDTDKRLLAQDMSSSYASDIRGEDGGERLIEEANLDLDEYQEADSDRQEEMLDEAEEIVSDNLYNEWLDGLEDPYHYLVEVQGLYSPSDFKNASFVQIDYEALAEALGYDYNFVNYDGEVYVFSSNFKRGGNVKTAVNRKKSRYKKAIKKYSMGGFVAGVATGAIGTLAVQKALSTSKNPKATPKNELKKFRVLYIVGNTTQPKAEYFSTKANALSKYMQLIKSNSHVSLDKRTEGTVNDWATIKYSKGVSKFKEGGPIKLKRHNSYGQQVEIINENDEHGFYGEIGTIKGFVEPKFYVVKFENDDSEYTYLEEELSLPLMKNGGNVGTIQKGDLIFAKNEGSRGLVGLVLTNPKKDSYGESVVSVYFRGYNGDILDVSIDDISEINFSNMVYFAENNGDISAYKSIAAKKGYYINQRYAETNSYNNGGNVGSIDADIAKLQAVVDSDMIPQEVKTKAKAKIAQLQAQKAELSKPAKEAKVDKKAPAKKIKEQKIYSLAELKKMPINKLNAISLEYERERNGIGYNRPNEKRDDLLYNRIKQIEDIIEAKESPKKPVVSKKATTKKAAPKKASKKTKAPKIAKPKNSEKGRIMVLAKELHKEGKTTWPQSLKKAGEMLRNKKGKPVVIKPTRIQKGTSDAKADKARVAAKPGKRISKSGRIYYENRKNRSDI
jgi:antirestriction protein